MVFYSSNFGSTLPLFYWQPLSRIDDILEKIIHQCLILSESTSSKITENVQEFKMLFDKSLFGR